MEPSVFSLRITGRHADEELRSLYEWLLGEQNLRRDIDIRLTYKEPAPGEMGDTLDFISLLVTSALAWPGFTAALAQWRQTRRNRPKITIERGDTTITLSDADTDLVVNILDAVKDHD
ncbi:hypothetical protein AB0K60_20185 [Thermopolyspora sp. NPDC052614]|uniref:effector-associated constant component EACC1 n=1 Tax=Thermopolyspora sp. NPDC052614 TaxID=3155682 RepID=UPI0034357FF5